MPPLVLGVNCAYHESCAALVRGGRVLHAVEEERLTRVKHGKPARVDNPDLLPWRAIESCLAAGHCRLQDLDAVAYSLLPGQRLRNLGLDPGPVDEASGFGTEAGEQAFETALARVPRLFEERGLVPGRFRFLSHHLCHAASAFYPSPFEQAAVLVVDGIGEVATCWLGSGQGDRLELLEEVLYPHSLGLLWERISLYLGFSAYDAPKVMGLAAFGEAASAREAMHRLLTVEPEGFRVDASLAGLRSPDVRGLEQLFGPRHRPGQPHEDPRLAGLAAALQERTEEALLALAGRLHRLTGLDRLCYAGGVALNCVANARLEREGPFPALYVPGAAHDAGTALGAALEAALRLGAARRPQDPPVSAFLGPGWDEAGLTASLNGAGTRVEDPAREAAARLAKGELVGWFQGALELGPRALGHRSLLGDPRRPDLREVLNDRVKHREAFRPFAAAVLEQRAEEWFELPDREPGARASRDLMLLAYPVRTERRERIPAVVHRDGTCRIQTVSAERDPLFARLLSEFEQLTGVPLVLNTSFNDSEPIVCTPEDALDTFRRCRLDALYLGPWQVLP